MKSGQYGHLKFIMRFYDPKNCTSAFVEDAAIALKQGLLPSVTTVLSVIHSPWLEEWAIKQALDHYRDTGDYQAALEYEDCSSSEFGTVCHELLQSFIAGATFKKYHNDRHRDAVKPLFKWIERHVAEVLFCEQSFADVELGYGGTADFLVLLKEGPLLLCDLKCKKNSAYYPMSSSLSYKYQLSAYRRHFEKIHGPMRIANFLLASPYGYDPKPKLVVCDYGEQDWADGFLAAQRLWLEQREDES